MNKCLHKHNKKEKKMLRNQPYYQKHLLFGVLPHLNKNNFTGALHSSTGPKYVKPKLHWEINLRFFGDACKISNNVWNWRSFPTLTILWFYDSMMLIKSSSCLNIGYSHQPIYITFIDLGPLVFKHRTRFNCLLKASSLFLNSQLFINLLETFIEGTIYFSKE